jgi:hypothetical protein
VKRSGAAASARFIRANERGMVNATPAHWSALCPSGACPIARDAGSKGRVARRALGAIYSLPFRVSHWAARAYLLDPLDRCT